MVRTVPVPVVTAMWSSILARRTIAATATKPRNCTPQRVKADRVTSLCSEKRDGKVPVEGNGKDPIAADPRAGHPLWTRKEKQALKGRKNTFFPNRTQSVKGL